MNTSLPDPYAALTAYQHSAALMAAGKTGLFQALAGGGLSAAEAADRCRISHDGAEALLRALAACGYLAATDGPDRLYQLNAFSRPFVETGAGGLARVLHKEALFFRLWGRLAEVVVTGEALLPGFRRRLAEQPELMETFHMALNDIAETAADGVIEAMQPGPESSLLDCGCGAGGYAGALASRLPELRIVAVDLPGPAALARAHLAGKGLGKRVEVVPGDFFSGPEALSTGTHELVLLSHVLHDYPEDELAEVIRAAAAFLTEEGRLVILDVLADEELAHPVEALFGLMMMLENPGGRTHRREILLKAIQQAGLKPERENKLFFGTLFSVVRA